MIRCYWEHGFRNVSEIKNKQASSTGEAACVLYPWNTILFQQEIVNVTGEPSCPKVQGKHNSHHSD